ncbi:MAG: DUF1465 family protein [Caulobacteraceae bacterium]|nr:DUF1465 family protein [Caulobacter sp.]
MIEAETSAAATGGEVLRFAGSELFDRTFAEGMALVEEAAEYLDGAGRQESKLLSRNGALAYAGESMKLTTRLMQVASWLLVQRAVKQGDMTLEEARQPRYRLGAKAGPSPSDLPASSGASEPLPAGLTDLVARAQRLFDRVTHLDRSMYAEVGGPAAGPQHGVLSQLQRLQQAFDAA